MLTLSDTRPSRHCEGLVRRDFLGVGSLALGGMGLAQMLSVRQALAAAGHPVRDKSVVLLFLSGGPPHIEMFDPKMSAPSEIHSCSGEVQTRIPGITFGGHFEKLSQMTDRFSIVRSYRSNNSGHTYQKVASGNNPLNIEVKVREQVDLIQQNKFRSAEHVGIFEWLVLPLRH